MMAATGEDPTGSGATPADTTFDPLLDALRPATTGNLIVVFDEKVGAGEASRILDTAFGLRQGLGQGEGFAALAMEQESGTAGSAASFTTLLDDLGVAIVTPSNETSLASLSGELSAMPGVVEARPEYYLYAISAYADTAVSTWGQHATGADSSRYTGAGIKLAILDTGFDETHPDLSKYRGKVGSKNFVGGSDVADIQGHGTHCIGTAAGPRTAGRVAMGYGCAPDVELYVGKVLNDSGYATEGSVARGIQWAIQEGCAVISLSLGRAVRDGEPPTRLYENLGRRALAAGSLIVAAAGNESRRMSGFIAPVSEPANSSTVMSVAAVDSTLDIAYFSSGGVNSAGGDVDIAAPGVAVFSSFPMPRRYQVLQGTSMACPHVAGIAALWAQSDPSLRGQALWDVLLANALKLKLPPRDVGAGLVQAPTGSPVSDSEKVA